MRVRHHTDDAGLVQIKASGGIQPARGWVFVDKGRIVEIEQGVHVEVEPFGSPKPGEHGPFADMACHAEGAYVEFDVPHGYELVRYHCGPRNTALIATGVGESLRLADLHPRFVKVRRYWWQFWRYRTD